MKRLSVLEFKKNEKLALFFKKKQDEIKELAPDGEGSTQAELSLTLSPAIKESDNRKLLNRRNTLLNRRHKTLATTNPQSQGLDNNLPTSAKHNLSSNQIQPEEPEIWKEEGPVGVTLINKVFHIARSDAFKRKQNGSDAKGLKQMTKGLIRVLSADPSNTHSLDSICTKIGVEKRKIYDLINILSSIQMIERVSKGVYKWHGPAAVEQFVSQLTPFVSLPHKLKKEKSLGSMCFCFLSFMATTRESSIEAAAESLSHISKPPGSIELRSKIRRLYDISKILATVGLIQNVSQNKKPLLRWLGPEKMKETVRQTQISGGAPLQLRILQRLQASIKNAVLTVSQDEVRRKRLESVDFGIIEKFLSDQRVLVVPSANVLLPQL